MTRHLPRLALAGVIALTACGKDGDDTAAEEEAPRPVSGELSLGEADTKLIPPEPRIPQEYMSEEELDALITSLGIALSEAGDVNGDGSADLLVGADGGYGAAYLFHGPIAPGELVADAADATLTGIEDGLMNGQFALGVRGAGDLNGDGYADLLATDKDYDGEGALFVYYGPLTGAAAAEERFDVQLRSNGVPYAGLEAAAVGDVDGDGIPDLLVGSHLEPANGEDSGVAWLLHGPLPPEGRLAESASAWLVGASGYDRAGDEVAAAGDINGDGLADLLIGAPTSSSGATEAGAAYLAMAPFDGEVDLNDVHAKFVGRIEKDDAGAAIAGVGDVDGDGRDDFMVGAAGMDDVHPNAGGGYLVLDDDDKSRYLDDLIAFTGAAQGDGAGESLSGAGDIDGDGFADLLIGAPRESTLGEDTGATYLIYGGPGLESRSLADADARLMGEAQADDAGAAVAGLGDVSGDGYPDFAVGAYHEASVMTYGGAVYVFFGGPE